MEERILTSYLCFWLAVLGAVLGSFLDCAVSRWAAGETHPFGGRSRCAFCGKRLGAADLVPVFSFLFLRGRCRYCGERIPADCIWAELAGAAVFLCMGLRFGLTPALGQWLVFAALLLALSLTDVFCRVIPDKLLLLLLANRVLWFFVLGEGIAAARDTLLSCLIPAALLAFTLLWEKRSGKEAVGGGDIKLLFVLALYLDWAELLLGLLAGCLLGLIYAASARRGRGQTVPFGPFLAAGAVLTVCFGEPLLRWYFGFF